MTETLHTAAGRSVLRIERKLAHPPDKVWRALTEPVHDLHTGSRPPTAGDPRPGGFTTDGVAAGTVTEVNPPTLLEYEGPDGWVRWELGHGTGHGARLVLTHSGPSEQAGARSTALVAWQAHIEQLAAKLLTLPGSTGEPRPDHSGGRNLAGVPPRHVRRMDDAPRDGT